MDCKMQTETIIYTNISKRYESRLPIIKDNNIPLYVNIDNGIVDKYDNRTKYYEISHPSDIWRSDFINRYYKFFSEKIFSANDISIYIDGNVDIMRNLDPLVSEFIDSKTSLGIMRHNQRDNILEEVEACKVNNKFKEDDQNKILNQINSYNAEGYPQDYPLFTATVIFRRHNYDKKLNQAMELWWEQVKRFTCRDQISLPFVLWKTQLKHHIFDIDIFNNKYFLRRPHGSNNYYYYKYKNKILNMIR